jgi:PAS domain S-box-containing protein
VSIQDVTAWRNAEKAARESEAWSRSLFEDSPVALWEEDHSEALERLNDLQATGVTDLAGHLAKHPELVHEMATLVRVVAVNKTAIDLMGLDGKPELPLRLDEWLVPGGWHRFSDELVAMAQGATSHRTEEALMTRNLGERQVDMTWAVSPGHEEALSRVMVSVLDVTEQRRAEDALRESEWMARTLLNAPTDIALLVDPKGCILNVNDTLARIVGQKVEDLIGMSAWGLFPSAVSGYRQSQLAQVIDSGQPVRLEEHRDGTWYDTVAQPVLNDRGEVMAVAIFARDITHRKDAEEELRHSLQETDRAHRLLLALSQAAQAVQQARDAKEIYKTLGEQVRSLGYGTTVFALSTDGSQVTTPYASYEAPIARALERLAGPAAENYRFALVPDGCFDLAFSQEEAFLTESPVEYAAEALPQGARHRAPSIAEMVELERAIIAPLTIDEDTPGLLVVTGSGLQETDVPAVSAFADQTSIALANARLLEELRALATDLEHRVRARTSELTASEARYRTVFDSNRDSLIIVDPQGHVIDANPAACQLLGCGVEELRGPSNASTDAEFSFQDILTLMDPETINWRESISSREAQLGAFDGQERPVSVSVAPLSYEGREAALCSLRDIRAEKEAEAEIRLSQQETERRHNLVLALSNVAQTVQRAKTPDDVYETLGREMGRLGYIVGTLVWTGKDHEMQLVHLNLEEEHYKIAEQILDMPVSELRFAMRFDAVLRPVLVDRESMYFEDMVGMLAYALDEHPTEGVVSMARQFNIVHGVYSPILLRSSVAGILIVVGPDLTREDLPAVSALANQASIALENAQLLEELSAGQERLQRLAREVITTQEEERRKLSGALHDETGQSLTALKISLELMSDDIGEEQDALREDLVENAALVTETMNRLRMLAKDLRPPALDAIGLGHTLEGMCRDQADRTGLAIDYRGEDPPTLPEPASITLYRVLQESLTNIAKHASASHVRVRLDHDAEEVILSVQDDGEGFDPELELAPANHQAGVGLAIMQDRLESLGGRLVIESADGAGTSIMAHLPIEEG